MDLDALKSEWKNLAEASPKQQEQIRKMAEKGSFKFINRIRRRLLVEVIVMSLLLLVYIDWFDGHLKPLWVNVLLGCSLVLLIGHDFMIYRSVNLQFKGLNLKQSLQRLFTDLQLQSRVSVVLMGLFYLAWIVFLTINITFTPVKIVMLPVIMMICLVALWIIARQWRKVIHQLKSCIEELEEN